MKNLIWLFVAAVLFSSCEKEPVNYASIKGELEDKTLGVISIQGQEYQKEIAVADGVFSDTLNVKDGMYMMVAGSERMTLYLKNGYDLEILFNNPNSESKISFVGEGAETNNYLEEKRTFFMGDYANPNSYFELEQDAYDARIAEAKKALNESSINVSKVDTTVVSMVSKSEEQLFSYVGTNYERMHQNAVKLAKGAVSPVFENYENFAGGTTSLSDLKGKFVYIDIWATWCGPCKREIPNLKALEKDFHGKNIEFVSISVDNVDGRRGSHASWLEMVKEKELGGVQLFADKDFNSEFIQEYGINSIPRFILIDPEGNIVDSNAMRPSDPKVRDYFKELGI